MVDLSKKDVEDLQNDVEETIKGLNLEEKRLELIKLENDVLQENFWSNSSKAQDTMSHIAYIKDEIETIEKIKNDTNSLYDLFISLEKETQQNELIGEYNAIRESLEKFSLRKFLAGRYDSEGAVLTINAGQGGTEANDWAEMLFRMYTMYLEKNNWRYKITNILKGSEVGISTVTLEIMEPYAFGTLKKEHGAHRLVRISPFNAQGLRQTTFAGVEILPLLRDNEKSIDIPSKDILFKAVRSGGPGGQNVNKTSSAVQITHIPTGITVHSSEQKSQAQNKENAMRILKSKLLRIKEDEKIKEISDIKGNYKIAGWGNQIRNYVLHPYKLVKDLRTNIETSDIDSVLDGHIDEFLEAEIRLK